MHEEKDPGLKKAILFYSIELFVFAAIFLVIGILRITQVLTPWNKSDNSRLIPTIITLVGGVLVIGNFIWTLVSKKHRKMTAIQDVAMTLPIGLAFIVIDIIYFINKDLIGYQAYNAIVGGAFCYLGAIYIFQGVYHYFHPLTAIIEAAEADRLAAIEEAREQQELAKSFEDEDDEEDQ